MVHLNRSVGGFRFPKGIALTEDAQGGLERAARIGAGRASMILNSSRYRTGDSSIAVDTKSPRVDVWVVLDDTRGKKAALAIEYGYTDVEGNYHAGPAPLHRGVLGGRKRRA